MSVMRTLPSWCRTCLLVAMLFGAPACYEPPAVSAPDLVEVSYDLLGDAIVPRQRAEVAARSQAAIDFGCPGSLVARVVREGPDDHGGTVGTLYRIEGCDHGGMYLGVQVEGPTSSAPGNEGQRRYVRLRRFVDVARDDAARSLASLDRHAASIGLEPPPVGGWNRSRVTEFDARTVAEYVKLGAAASRDLACQRQSLVLEIVEHPRAPSTYLAEGCGFRGLFVKNGVEALVITSRVALAPPPAASP
jgi:hypothetical protein